MIERRIKYLKSVLLLLLCLVLNHVLVAQVKEKLKTGIYKVVEKSSYKVTQAKSKETLFLDTVPICRAEDFRKVSLNSTIPGFTLMQVQLGDKGTEKFAKSTKDNAGKRFAILVNGELLSAPLVQYEITSGELEISGDFSAEEVQEFIDKINKEIPQEKPTTKEEKQKESEIWQSCAALDSALIKRNKDLRGLLHDKLSFGHSNGLIESKEEVLQHLQSGYLKYFSITKQGYKEIQLVDNVASVRRQVNVFGALEGKEFEINLKVLEIWIRTDKKWQLLSRQAVKKV
jgi:Domain of unknown function (DUF4440)